MLATILLCTFADPAGLTELERLAGTWATTKTQIVIRADSTVGVLYHGKEEFEGRIAVVGGKLTLHKDGEAWLTAGYRLAGDKMTVEIDGKQTEYFRKPAR